MPANCCGSSPEPFHAPVVNLLLAPFIIWTIPLTARTLPGYILGVSFLMSGIIAIADTSVAPA